MVKISNYWKYGFGASAGFATTILLGLLFLIPGFILVTRENKKPKGDRNTTLLVIGFIIMFIGVALSFGIGGGQALNSLANQF